MGKGRVLPQAWLWPRRRPQDWAELVAELWLQCLPRPGGEQWDRPPELATVTPRLLEPEPHRWVEGSGHALSWSRQPMLAARAGGTIRTLSTRTRGTGGSRLPWPQSMARRQRVPSHPLRWTCGGAGGHTYPAGALALPRDSAHGLGASVRRGDSPFSKMWGQQCAIGAAACLPGHRKPRSRFVALAVD